MTAETRNARGLVYQPIVDMERVAQLLAHRACHSAEHDPANGRIHGYCVVCGVPWPCAYAGEPPTSPPPPAEAQACGCGEATCVEPWEPGCGLGSSVDHAVVAPESPREISAEAQAQGGGRAHLAQQPAAVDMPAIWHRLGWAENAVPDDWRVLVREARESIETLWKAQQPAAVGGDFINRIADSLIAKGWDIDPNCDGTGVAQLREAVISAIAQQPADVVVDDTRRRAK